MRVVYCVFFFKQKTAYEMRISDWSSDVCSSDLLLGVLVVAAGAAWLFFHGVGATGGEPAAMKVIASAVLVAVAVFCLVGLYKVEPNQAAVLSLFGKYEIGRAHV